MCFDPEFWREKKKEEKGKQKTFKKNLNFIFSQIKVINYNVLK